jgi:polysaccharide biosynthesis protein PslF
MSLSPPLRSAPMLRAAVPGSAMGRAQSLRLGMVSTYPPKLCGLATFAAALARELAAAGNRVDVVRVDDGDDPSWIPGSEVARLVNGSAMSVRAAAAQLSRCDSVIIQHEYGIFGGADGDEVLDLMRAIDAPTIVVLHTVPLVPTDHQHDVLVEISRLANRVVVMTEAARDRLLGAYPVDPRIVVTIPHGATLPTASLAEHDTSLVSRSAQLLTWGLLGPGKGVEHVIDALGLLTDLPRRPHYTVAGVTHPKVFAARGDEYRHALIRQGWATGVAGYVEFDDDYRDLAGLTKFVASTDIVVLPYDSFDQVTSGVLVDAVAAGRPVIATAFPHAVELLGSGAGIVVPHRDPAALADAIRAMVTQPTLLAEMTAEAQRLAPTMSWSHIAGLYAQLAQELSANLEPVAM